MTFTFFISQSSSLLTASACAANASLASIKSRSPISQLAILNAFFTAFIGPIPIIVGSTPTVAHEIIFANGERFREFAFSSLIKHTAAAPSLMPDAFPADTLPSFLKTGLSLLMASKVEPCLGNSSDAISISSFFL